MRFQFHKGAIGVFIAELEVANFTNFNSIKVRLEYQKGIELFGMKANFNSIKVRLELLKDAGLEDIETISIP